MMPTSYKKGRKSFKKGSTRSHTSGYIIAQNAIDEEQAIQAAKSINYRVRRENEEKREAAKQARDRAKITLPKLKFMDPK